MGKTTIDIIIANTLVNYSTGILFALPPLLAHRE